MQVILLERISRLGNVGETVNVKPGYARNYLLPTRKALRATQENKAFFDAQRDVLERNNEQARVAAEKRAANMKNLSVTVIRQAADDGKLYGSVAVRDIADALAEAGHEIERRLIDLAASIKSLGVYSAVINLHAEVQVPLTIHVARNLESKLAAELTDNAETTAEEEVA
jgi:large subunit ribosomal protein L9